MRRDIRTAHPDGGGPRRIPDPGTPGPDSRLHGKTPPDGLFRRRPAGRDACGAGRPFGPCPGIRRFLAAAGRSGAARTNRLGLLGGLGFLDAFLEPILAAAAAAVEFLFAFVPFVAGHMISSLGNIRAKYEPNSLLHFDRLVKPPKPGPPGYSETMRSWASVRVNSPFSIQVLSVSATSRDMVRLVSGTVAVDAPLMTARPDNSSS